MLNLHRPKHNDKAYADYAFALCTDRHIEESKLQPGLPGGGGNFADHGLRILVKQAKRTFLTFCPAKSAHSTTASAAATNYIVVFAFSAHIGEACVRLQEAMNGRRAFVESVAGASNESHEDSTDI